MDSQSALWGFTGISLTGLLILARQYGRLELKVDTLWSSWLRQGLAEGKVSDIIRQNSPLSVSQEMIEALTPLKADLRKFYLSGGNKLSEIEQAIEIERRFGPRLVNEVCVPAGKPYGACLVAAMIYGKSFAKLQQVA